MNRRIQNQRGFTLGELLVVIAIMTILVAVAVGSFTGLIGSGSDVSKQYEKEAVDVAIEAYMNTSLSTTIPERTTAAVITSGDSDAPFTTFLRRTPTQYTYSWTTTGSVSQGESASGGPGGASWVNAYSTNFDGNNDIVVGPSTNTIIGENVQNMTMSCWVKTTNSAAQYVMSLKRATPSSHSTLFTMGVNNPTSQVYLLTWNGSSHTYLNSIGESVNDGGWHHICAVVDGSTRTLYLDGNSVGSDSNGIANVTGNTDYFTVGGFADPYGSLFFGDNIDEVSIWTASLDSGDITELYNSGSPGNLSGHSAWSDCVLWWRMGDEDTYPTLADNRGSNDGTMINMESSDIEADIP